MNRITAFAGALLCLLITGFSPAMAGALHPRCNIDWPCAGPVANFKPQTKNDVAGKLSRSTSARADRFRNVEFGSPMYPPETQRSFISGVSTPARFVGGRLKCAVNIGVALAERGIRAPVRRWLNRICIGVVHQVRSPALSRSSAGAGEAVTSPSWTSE